MGNMRGLTDDTIQLGILFMDRCAKLSDSEEHKFLVMYTAIGSLYLAAKVN